MGHFEFSTNNVVRPGASGMIGSQQVFWLNTYIRPNIHSDVQYCLTCPPNSTVALILACNVRQELAGHLGTRSALSAVSILHGIPRQMLHTAMVSRELAMASAV